MKSKKIRTILFFVGSVLLALPWLTPCTMGVGTTASGVVGRLSLSSDDPLGYLPDDHLKKLAAKPGPHLTTAMRNDAEQMISDRELASAGARNARRMSVTGAMDRFAGGLAQVLAASDLMTAEVLGHQSADDSHDRRRQFVLCESPYVVLTAKEIQFVPADVAGGLPKLVRASGGARVMVVTSEGSFFGLASQIHFRGPSPAVVLVGDPTVQSGEQFIKGRDPGTTFRLDYARRSVTSTGPLK